MTRRPGGRRPPRILHAPWNVGGNPLGLSRAERELGLRSDVLALGGHPFGYEADIDLGVGGRMDPAALRKRRWAVVRALARYDVIHFNFGQTLYERFDAEGRIHTELAWLKRLGKTVLATFQGDDARPPDANPFAPYTEGERAWQEKVQPQRRDGLLHHADRVFFLNPDLRHWLPGAEFRPYANFDPRSVTPAPLPDRDGLVVAHAPSDRSQKGTDRVLAAIEELRGDGVAIELDLIEGVPREQALERTANADVVVDQLNIGWYGGYAVEAMSLGRAVLAYVRDDEPADNPMGDELPIVRTTADTLAAKLCDLAGDRPRLREIGAAGRAFAEVSHDPRRIAAANLKGLVELPPVAS